LQRRHLLFKIGVVGLNKSTNIFNEDFTKEREANLMKEA
jgi:hypothetical protein